MIQDLNRLKILNLSHSQNLVKTPNLHSSSLEKLILKGCSSLVKVHQSIGNLTSLVFLNLEGYHSLKILPESISNIKSLKRLNISGCSQLEKLPECMGNIEFLTQLLADEIENEQFLSLIQQLKHIKKSPLRGYTSVTGVLNWKCWLPTSFIFNVKRAREVVRESSPLHLGRRTRIWNPVNAWNVLDHQKVRAQCIHESIVVTRIF